MFIFGTATVSYAQVGINTTNSALDHSAMLDVSSLNKGLLVPGDADNTYKHNMCVFSRQMKQIN
jgi:hypothetical protein